ncbi:MAG: hypothetical protein Ct9H90mP3_2870 [Flammeovirgaceae bacterium]|nr:MAG: hypothetical protein Ct9H90mP3_2870 [Flammeovirgaceae bacterium]
MDYLDLRIFIRYRKNSTKGLENNSLVPLDIERNIRGGTIYKKFVFELRHPISLNPKLPFWINIS